MKNTGYGTKHYSSAWDKMECQYKHMFLFRNISKNKYVSIFISKIKTLLDSESLITLHIKQTKKTTAFSGQLS